MKLFLFTLLTLFTLASGAQTSGNFVVKGEVDKFYPVSFYDGMWASNQSTILTLGRSDVHTDVSWRGSLIATFSFHVTKWGHQSAFIHADLAQGGNRPDPNNVMVASWADKTAQSNDARIVIWLRGGTTTYYYSANSNVLPLVYDGVQNALPMTDGGISYTYKTAADYSVNPDGKNIGGNLYVQGMGTSFIGGRLGIGTTNPGERLHVDGNAVLGGVNPYLQISDRITLQSTSVPENDWTRGYLGHNVGWNTATKRWKIKGEPYTDFSMVRFENGGNISFYVRNTNSSNYELTDAELATYKRMKIDWNGNVGIGTDDPKGYRLAVNGWAIFTKAVVKQYTAWPDYVFQHSYNLPRLPEVEAYIKKYQHLPDVPSAAELDSAGLNLGDMQATLLKKIEELTLYAIEQDKKIRLQQQQQDDLLKRLEQAEEALRRSRK